MIVIGRLRTLYIITLLTALFAVCVSAKDYKVEDVPNVRLTDKYNHVSNPDGVISSEAVASINRILNAVEDTLGIEVAVVAIDGIGDEDARSFATELFNYWKLGKKQKDNGLLIQLVVAPEQRSIVFETGYGIEGVLPDAICYRLQQRYMITDLRNGDYSAGMLSGVEAVSAYLLASDYERNAIIGRPNTSDDDEVGSIIGTMVGFFVIVILVVVLVNYLNHRPKVCPNCGKKTLVYCGKRTIVAATRRREGLEEEIWRCTNCGHTEKKSRTISRISDAAGPIIIGGGMGGFGGGGFGGGSWGGGSSGGGGSISRF
jgi:uncharacterized protein